MYAQTQQARTYFPTFADNRSPFSNSQARPQTPLGTVPSNVQGVPVNRSYNKLPNTQYNPQYGYPPPQRNNISRSRVSMSNSQASHLTNLVNEPDVFPEELVFLLRNEEKNINVLKEKVEKEKARVENDFAVFRAEIDHIIEDVKISVQAELDLVYKAYITKYAELKGEVQDLRLMRKEILMNNQNGCNYVPQNASVSNKDLINEIEKDAEHMRNFRVYGYLGELQKAKLEPIGQLANDLIVVGSAQCPFYRHKEMTGKFKEVKNNFGSIIKEVFDTLDEYVVTPESLLEREKAELENTRTVLRELEAADSTKMKAFDVHFPANSRADDRTTKDLHASKDLKASKDVRKGKKFSQVGSNEQVCVTRWCEEVRLNRLEKVETDHSDSILCIHFVGDRYVATGSKDTTINIYSLDGRKLRTLRGHEAAICCMAYVRSQGGDMLASGSDNGCGSVILWDAKNWQMVSKIQAHEAAVTSIVDLEDGKHIATGSYDKKINVFSVSRSQKIVSLNNRTSVTGMVMTSDRSRLVTAGLDKSVSVWSIRRNGGVVEEVVAEKVIANEELVCQLQPSLLRPDLVYCACRDGALRVLNLVSGTVERSYTVNANSLIQLVAIEREMNAESPMLLSCSCKDSALVLTKMDTGLSSLVKIAGGLGIDYGCGIGPKVVISEAREGVVAVVSQRKDNREFGLFELELK